MTLNGSLNRFFVLSLFIILLNPVNTYAEDIDYTEYENNTNTFCHGIHVGDKFEYEQNRNVQYLYKNGTIEINDNGVSKIISENDTLQVITPVYESSFPRTILVNVTMVPPTIIDPTNPLWDHYKIDFDSGNPGDPSPPEKLGSFGIPDFPHPPYFIFIDDKANWHSWENMYANKTLEELDIYHYNVHTNDAYITTLSNEYFSIHFISDNSQSLITRTLRYNLTNGILELQKDTIIEYEHGDFLSVSLITITNLVSRDQVSNDIVCLELEITNELNSDESPVLGFLSSILLIPIVRRYRSKHQ